MALRKTTHVRLIRHTGSRTRHVDLNSVAKALGAEMDLQRAIRGSRVTTTALRQQVLLRLASSGGRPGLDGTTLRPKVPMTPEDWSALEQLASAFAAKGVKATPSQVASAIIHTHVAQIKGVREDGADLEVGTRATVHSGSSSIAESGPRDPRFRRS
jgi:hypothetical protein